MKRDGTEPPDGELPLRWRDLWLTVAVGLLIFVAGFVILVE
jgi:hypothetical protein